MLLDVSFSVVQRLWDQYNPKILCQKTCSRPITSYNTCRRPFSSSFGTRTTTVPQLVADHFQASGRRISATTVINRLHNAGLYDQLCAFPSTDDSEGTAYAGQENMFLGRSNNFCAVHRRVRFTMESDSGRLSGGNSALDTINPTLLKDTVIGGGILVWAGISLGGHTDLACVPWRNRNWS
ncbi:transposable element Tcb2 transposase [Trichonephila clavipes]|nr:transposable element Tcb2 transposase [Trichonephila clavipes]